MGLTRQVSSSFKRRNPLSLALVDVARFENSHNYCVAKMNHLNRHLSKQLQLAARHFVTPSIKQLAKRHKVHELDAIHIPVMKDEVLNLWAGNSDNNRSFDNHLIDGTVGLGGHSLAALKTGAIVLGIDRDPYILRMARRRFDSVLYPELEADDDNADEPNIGASAANTIQDTTTKQYALHHGSYADISPELLQSHSFPSKVDGILLDLGMNTYQIENAHRGFTFRRQGPLDMRFNAQLSDTLGSPLKAYEVVNTYTADELATLFDRHANEPYAIQIADAIVKWRTEKNAERARKDKKRKRSSPKGIVSTLELRYIIEDAISKHCNTIQRTTAQHLKRKEDRHARYRKIWRHQEDMVKSTHIKQLTKKYEEDKVVKADHVMRCFQAIRIETNDELKHLESFLSNLDTLNAVLNVGGRLVTIAFQPGEDELVRHGMEAMVDSGDFRLLTPEEEGLRPSEEEVKANGKSRTARLRAVEKIK